jgi:hypothetical protein
MSSLRGVKRPIAATTAVLACLVIVAGCGEKDEPATTGPLVTTDTSTTSTGTTTSQTTTTTPDDSKPATSAPAAVQAFLSSPDAELVCNEMLTEEFLRKAYGDRAGCIAARKPATLAAANSKLEVGPESDAGTRVDAVPKGGVYDGDKLQITVLSDGDAYLIAAVKSNAPVGP